MVKYSPTSPQPYKRRGERIYSLATGDRANIDFWFQGNKSGARALWTLKIERVELMTDATQQMVALLPRLRRFAYALTGSKADGDDLVQASCEKALRALHQWTDGTRLDSWMYRIMQNAWIDQKRAQSRRAESVAFDQVPELVGRDGRDDMDSRMVLDQVRRAMMELPKDQSVVLALVTVEGLSYQEAADVLELPIGTVMSRLARGRKRLLGMVGVDHVSQPVG